MFMHKTHGDWNFSTFQISFLPYFIIGKHLAFFWGQLEIDLSYLIENYATARESIL